MNSYGKGMVKPISRGAEPRGCQPRPFERAGNRPDAREEEASRVADATGGAFSQARIHSRTIALQIAGIEAGKLAKRVGLIFGSGRWSSIGGQH
jgi:hypothetical protein